MAFLAIIAILERAATTIFGRGENIKNRSRGVAEKRETANNR
jgi:hypothetical protein